MVEFFSDSLLNGFWQSSGMGKGIVLVQLAGSLVMFTFIFGKIREIRGLLRSSRRVGRDILRGQSVLSHYLDRKDNEHSPVENIYWRTCERLVNQFAPEVRAQIIARQPGVRPTMSEHSVDLVKSIAEQVYEEESIRAEWGMGVIATVVALAPMLGLLGTVWGVLDAFADMGAAGSATIATMAPAISSALVTTVVGLLIAIPGVIAHNWLSSRLHELLTKMDGFLDDFMGCIRREFQASGRGV